MFITPEEMKTVLYEYQMMQIAENDQDIVTDGIMAAVSEVRAYFEAANARRETANLTQQQYAAWKLYDVEAIFSATGTDRNAFVVRLCQRIAAWNICDLANVDIINDRLKERYELTIATLEKVAGMGDYAQSRIVLSELPSPEPAEPDPSASPDAAKPFRMVSRRKFNHE